MVESRRVDDGTGALDSGESDGLAWPGEHDVEQQPVDINQPWSTAWSRAATLLLIGVTLATVIVVAGWLFTTPKSPPATGQSPTSTAPTTSSAPITTSITSTPDQDNKYIQSLNDRGISFANPHDAIHNGKVVCQNIGQGMTVQQVVTQFQSSSPSLVDVANAYVAISVRTYCPQFGTQVAGM